MLQPREFDSDEVRRRVREWYCVMEADHAALMAGLRRKIGASGDINAAFREWCRENKRLKDEELERVQAAREQKRLKS